VVYFREIKEEKRKTTIQMTVNVERVLAGYSSRVSIKNKFEILIRGYEKR
jgi:hypothetical protein